MSEIQKTVSIVGLSIGKKFGSLRATELTFDENNLLTVFKGRTGAGKSTLQKALKLTTTGSKVLEDKNLYGDVDLVAQLLDGDQKVFVGCRTNQKSESLDYFLYTLDSDGKKVKEPVIDGKKATPASYLSSLQTALTWRLSELTSENSTVQRNILLELYPREMEEQGVIFDKSHPKYVGSVIELIEREKNVRSNLDMKRKEVGGIADDLSKKGIDYKERKIIKPITEATEKIADLKADIKKIKEDPEKTKQDSLKDIQLEGASANTALRNKNDLIKKHNLEIQKELDDYELDVKKINDSLQLSKDHLQNVKFEDDFFVQTLWDTEVVPNVKYPVKPEKELQTELIFNEKGSFVGKLEDYTDLEVIELIKTYIEIVQRYTKTSQTPAAEVDTTEKDLELKTAEKTLNDLKIFNEEAISVNAFLDWKECNERVNEFKKDYFNKLTEINTGIKGLTIAPEFIVNAEGQKIAKDDADIFLWYNGEHDPEYFYNPKKEIRKLSSYSGTQRPMICLLIQEYLLSKKPKALRYLWIDDVPIDKSTGELLDKMSKEMDLHLFINWTGDFETEDLKDGEILIENGEIFLPNKE